MKDTNRIDHFVWVVRPENADRYEALLSELFDTTFERFVGDRGVAARVSWDAGLELVSPVGSGPSGDEMRAKLDQNGEGPITLVFRVPDIEAATERAAKLGWPVSDTLLGADDAHKQWTGVTRLRERLIGSFLGTDLMFGEIDYAQESPEEE